MSGSIKIGRFAGIDVFMHFTFILLVGWVALVHWQRGQSVTAVLMGVAFILAIFLCVVLHEYGHALMARRYGIKTRDIILLPIGGVARLEKIPAQPIQELWVALAGPAVNVVIAVILFVVLQMTATIEPLQALTLTTGPFLERVLAVNIFMILFNMIPAFPMDGGRVLRAVLATRGNYAAATRTAATIGQAIAVLFAIVGLLYYPMLLFIALFVWIGAAQEASSAQLKSAIGGIPVQEAMVSDFKVLEASDTLDHAVELTLSGSQKDFPVLDNGSLEGILTQADLLRALSQKEKYPTVAAATQKEFFTVDARELMDAALARLNECKCHTLPVTRDGRLVGLVTMDNVGEFVRIQAASTN